MGIFNKFNREIWPKGLFRNRFSIPGQAPRDRILAFSAALHVLAVVVLMTFPQTWIVVVCAVLAMHLSIVAVSLWPTSPWPGPNIRRIDASQASNRVYLTFDDGPDSEVTPAVLEILAAYGVHATFFSIGARAEAHPEIIKRIHAAGHTVENHSYHHFYYFFFLSPQRLYSELQRAQNILTSLTSNTPRYFRAPAGLRSPFIIPVLRRLGLHLVSWTHRGFDTLSRDSGRIFQCLVKDLVPGSILLLHDGSAARDAAGKPLVLIVLPKLLDYLDRRRLQAVPLPAPVI